MHLILTETRRENKNQADRSFSRGEKRWRRGTYPLIPTLMVILDVVRGSGRWVWVGGGEEKGQRTSCVQVGVSTSRSLMYPRMGRPRLTQQRQMRAENIPIVDPYYTSPRLLYPYSYPSPPNLTTSLTTLAYPNMLARISTSPPLAAYSPRGSTEPGPFAYAVGPLGDCDCGCCDCWFWSLYVMSTE